MIVVHDDDLLVPGWPPHPHAVVLVVGQGVVGIVLEGHRAVAHVVRVVDVPVDQLDGDKVPVLAGVVQDQPLRLHCLELKVDVDVVVGLEQGQAEVRVVAGQRDGVVDRVLGVLKLDAALVVELLEVGLVEQPQRVDHNLAVGVVVTSKEST